ncbi:MAG: SgcJ/EcaC family oxidoreductase [Sphingomonadales bacterium]
MTNANEKLLDDMYAAWRAHDAEKVASYYAQDCVYEDMAMGVVNRGRDGVLNFAREVYGTMPDFRVEYETRFATETDGAGQWIITATWNGPFEGVDRTGRKVRFTGLSLYRFRDGKISHAKDCWDFSVMMKQMGLLREDLRGLE